MPVTDATGFNAAQFLKIIPAPCDQWTEAMQTFLVELRNRQNDPPTPTLG